MTPFDLPEDARITVLSFPTRIVLGAKALERLPEELERLGMRRPLLVTDQGVVKAKLAERVLRAMGSGVEPGVFDAVRPNPTEKDVEDGLAAYRQGKHDGIVALGGGSPLDAAKLIQLRVTHEPPLSRYDDAKGGDRFVRADLPPLIAIPTTAGTGSEVSRSGVAVLEDTGRKTVICSPHLMPKVALCDPELTLGLPPPITAATGMDAFTHCLEAWVSNGFHPLSDALALDGIARVTRSLPVAFENGGNLAARLDMMIAAFEGAIAFQKGLGACHSLAHALTPISGVHHGLANAVALPYVMEFNRASARAHLARAAVAMGEDPRSASEDALASRAIDRVRALDERVGIPLRFREVGVKETDLPRIAAKAFEDASHQANPRECTEADLLEIARAAF